LSNQRRKNQTGSEDSGLMSDEEMAAYLAEFDRVVIQPRVAAAGQSCANGRLALETLLMAVRGRSLLGLADDAYQAQIRSLMVPVSTVCMQEEYTKCHDHHIISDILPAAFRMERQASFFGVDGTSDWQAWRTNAGRLIMQCHVYRLDVDTTSGSQGSAWTFSERMKGSVTLRFNASLLDDLTAQISGTGTLSSFDYQIAYTSHCRAVDRVAPAPGMFMVSKLGFDLLKGGGLADIRIEYFPGANASTNTWADVCAIPPQQFTEEGYTWFNTYMVTVGSNAAYFNAEHGFFLDHWTIEQGSETPATLSIWPTLLNGGISYSAPSSFTLHHTPGA
jgi:hypothetical protein